MTSTGATTMDPSPIVIRPIRAHDKEILVGGLHRLSPESRYRRFFAPKAKLSAKQLRYLTEVDHHTHEALVAIDPRTGEGVGVARFHSLADGAVTDDASDIGRVILAITVERVSSANHITQSA